MAHDIDRGYDLGRRRLAGMVIVVAIVVWIGWFFQIPFLLNIIPGLPRMNPLSTTIALTFGLLLWFGDRSNRRVATSVMAAILGVSLIRVAGVIYPNLQPGIFFQQLIFGNATMPSSMASATALCYGLLATSWLFRLHRPKLARFRQSIIILAFTVGYLALIGFFFRATYVSTVSLLSAMSLPTAALVVMIATAMIFVDRGAGIMRLFAEPNSGGRIARGLLPAVLLFPVVSSLIGLAGVWKKYYSFEDSTALIVLINVAAFEYIVWRVARTVQVSEWKTEEYDRHLAFHDQEMEKFKQVTDASTDAVIITDTQPAIIYVNPAWELLTGYRQAEVVGKNPRFVQSGKTPPDVYRQMWSAVTQGQPFATESIINRRKDGTEYNAQMQIYPVKKNNKNIFLVGIQQDITERTAIDRAKTEFVSMAAHQLRTPLTAINWFVELLRDSGKLGPEQERFLQQIDDGSHRMAELVNDLLNTSRIDLGTLLIEPQPMLIEPIARSLSDELEPQLVQKSIRLASTVEAAERFLADPILLRVVLQNLLTNAIRYTPVGGHVSLRATVAKQGLEVEVMDSGYGIPAEAQSKIFTKMFRADNVMHLVPDGTGLGLYIVKAIVDQSGGTIHFTSRPGRTVFTVRWPSNGMTAKAGSRQLS